MEKLDLSVNIMGHFLCQGDSRLKTPHKQINLTSRSEHRSPSQGPVLSSFRERRDTVLKHRASQKYLDNLSQDVALDSNASKVINLESEWNEQKRSSSQKPTSDSDSVFSRTNRQEGSSDERFAKVQYDYKNYITRNVSKFNISHMNENQRKDTDDQVNNTWNPTTPTVSSFTNTSITPKMGLCKPTVEKSTLSKKEEVITSIGLTPREFNKSGLKHKLNILDKILSKKSNYSSTRTTPLLEVPLKCEVQPTKLGSQDILTKETLSKQNEAKSGNRTPVNGNIVNKTSPKSTQIQPKAKKTITGDLVRSPPPVKSLAAPLRSKNNKEDKKTLKYSNKVASPIFVQVNLTNHCDTSSKENKCSITTPISRAIANWPAAITTPATTTPSSRSKAKNVGLDTCRSGEKVQSINELKTKSPNSAALKFRDPNQGQESKSYQKLEESRSSRSNTSRIKSFKDHLFEMNLERKNYQERIGVQTSREPKRDNLLRKQSVKQIDLTGSKQSKPVMNERDRLYQHIVQRLYAEKE